MPHIVNETTKKSEMTLAPPFGPGVSQEIADRAVRMELWGASFDDPGPDFCELVLCDEAAHG
jgi:hypothetical protein